MKQIAQVQLTIFAHKETDIKCKCGHSYLTFYSATREDITSSESYWKRGVLLESGWVS